WIAPPNSRSFSVSVVLPASGCEMIAKVRRRATSRASPDAAGAAASTAAAGASTAAESALICSFIVRCMWQAIRAGSRASRGARVAWMTSPAAVGDGASAPDRIALNSHHRGCAAVYVDRGAGDEAAGVGHQEAGEAR